ncbi:MAG: hypothetical protein Q7S58_15755 [Candidatus Binatus sp.]|uniref:ABC-three component system protein n=1 Tax=Candidatus Binatus sp. TaxID=2811406 RepID=UPI0027290AC3|nr:ABC-three component system protein [Candidatus Binatus sp.]MDO8433856.1 hypothetical protein [Candidatus Binatus sp.]
MEDKKELRDLTPAQATKGYTAEHVAAGIPIPKPKRVELFSPVEWEQFTEEWASSLKGNYVRVARFAGAGDKGLDVVGFIAEGTFTGGWENYQCKHYDHPLWPSDIWVEIGKIVYYSFKGEFPPPRKHYFVASKGIGTSLEKLLSDPQKLKAETRKNWTQSCEHSISSTFSVPLVSDLNDYFDAFNFRIFGAKSVVELIEEHSQTPFHSVRFGGGLPARPAPAMPPAEIAPIESRYIQQLFEAYGEHLGSALKDVSELDAKPYLRQDFLRQRERFYHAESLRNFARDTVPDGTFETLQDEVHQGVVDTCAFNHHHGLDRMHATVSQAATISISSSPLSSVVKIQDKQGICHQLANADRLTWVVRNGDD